LQPAGNLTDGPCDSGMQRQSAFNKSGSDRVASSICHLKFLGLCLAVGSDCCIARVASVSGSREAVLAKKFFKYDKSYSSRVEEKRLTGERRTAVVISHGPRIAGLVIQ
jgi:hypothetical protein